MPGRKRGRRQGSQSRRPVGSSGVSVSRLIISATLSPSIIKRLDAYAEMLGWTRSAVIELVLDRELSHVMDRALEVIGRKVGDGEKANNSERDG